MSHTHSDAATAARAQHEATVIGWVAGTPIPRERLDARVRQLRAGRLAARLPTMGSKEDRQFLRWTAQVLLTEELCRVEVARLEGESGLEAMASDADADHQPETARASSHAAELSSALPAAASPELSSSPAAPALSQAESLHLGSINAAAWSSTPAMSVLYHLVTDPTPLVEPAADTRTWYRVTHTVAATPLEAATAPESSLGWTTLDDLPATLAAELRIRALGTRVGPVRTGLGWHFATITATDVRHRRPSQPADTTDPTRLAAFNRWLDQRRRDLVVHAPGFEHPGDPGQPDNTHRH